MPRPANPFVGDIIGLSISGIEHWKRCRRLYRSKHLLRLPEPDRPRDAGLGLGLLVHAALHDIHVDGSCRDTDHVDDVLDRLAPGHGEVLRSFVDCHARSCPTETDWQAHEHELARFHRLPPPMWMLTGKIDSLWLRSRMLDVRDYKTGKVFSDRVADDFAARAQAWLLAPLAAQHGARLRITYEHLGARPEEWPEPYEPEDEDIAATADEIAAIVQSIASESDFAGVGESWACTTCGFASICPDAHANEAAVGFPAPARVVGALPPSARYATAEQGASAGQSVPVTESSIRRP